MKQVDPLHTLHGMLPASSDVASWWESLWCHRNGLPPEHLLTLPRPRLGDKNTCHIFVDNFALVLSERFLPWLAPLNAHYLHQTSFESRVQWPHWHHQLFADLEVQKENPLHFSSQQRVSRYAPWLAWNFELTPPAASHHTCDKPISFLHRTKFDSYLTLKQYC